MRLWSYCIAADQVTPAPWGYVWAKTAAQALTRIDHLDANVYQLPADAYCEGSDVLNPVDQPVRRTADVIPLR